MREPCHRECDHCGSDDSVASRASQTRKASAIVLKLVPALIASGELVVDFGNGPQEIEEKQTPKVQEHSLEEEEHASLSRKS